MKGQTARRKPAPPPRRSPWTKWALIGGGGAFVLLLLILNLRNTATPTAVAPTAVPMPAVQQPVSGQPLSLSQQIGLGRQVYEKSCASCHGINLQGQPGWEVALPDGGRLAPPHDETGHTWHHDDASLFQTVKLGGQAVSPQGYKNNMPRFAHVLSDDDIWAVLTYIKSTWSPAIQAQQQRGHQ